MASAHVQTVGDIAPNGTSSSRVATIAGTTAGSFLIVSAYVASGAGSETVTSNGTGTWSSLFEANPGTGRNLTWVCKNPGAGTTTVTVSNNGVNSQFTIAVMEISGLDSSATPLVSADKQPVGVTAWDTNSVNPSGASMAISVCGQGAGQTPTSTAGSGWTAPTGTGITTAGNVQNSHDGDCLFVEYKNVSSGSMTGSGTWGSAVNCDSWVMTFADAVADTLFGQACL